eukprot:1148840-Pelagomonas_calceolata.AAC.5
MPNRPWHACQVLGRMVGWLVQPKNCLQKFPRDLYSTSHCLLRPSDTAGLPKHFAWEGNQNSRMGGALGGPGQPGVNSTGRQANPWG